ncbi:Inactive poly [ADP-ribose] polymerase RCD1 [Acorus gramineus]|uniref:Inactive poly [ADP-ribose] polymerase RCD1 n=1 Tax=Acorus gramineus TaxID=55184 RepID=A0AAV9AID3_ACOGR|nr:Inactive poly [ADP-ribose] polymerase RCD1 [Acorus gramineus]
MEAHNVSDSSSTSSSSPSTGATPNVAVSISSSANENHNNFIRSRTSRPTSPWMKITMLFSTIENEITPATRAALHLHYAAFRRREITRQELIGRIRVLIGDGLLRSTIRRFGNGQSFILIH